MYRCSHRKSSQKRIQHNDVGVFDRWADYSGRDHILFAAARYGVHVEGNYKRVCDFIKCGEILYV